MAGKTKEMSQIKQLLLLKKEGVSNRKAAAIVGINKETVNNYVKKALADELGLEGLLKFDDPYGTGYRLVSCIKKRPAHLSFKKSLPPSHLGNVQTSLTLPRFVVG